MSRNKALFDTLKAIISKRTGLFCYTRNSELSKKSYLGSRTRFYNSKIGKYSYTGRNAYFFKTIIGNFTSIGDGCQCGMPEHDITYVSTSPVFMIGPNRLHTNFLQIPRPKYRDTEIGHDVWIGANVLIKAGVKIGNGAIIGMGSVVTKDIPSYAIAVGNPAKVIRYRFEDNDIEQLNRTCWWEFDDEQIKKCADAFRDPRALIEASKIL